MKQSRITVLAFLIVILATSAAAQSNERAIVEEQGKQFIAAVKKGDAAAVAAMYTVDSRALPPNEEMAAGRAAIQRSWQGAIDAGVRNLAFHVIEVERRGDSIYEVGKYILVDAGGTEIDRGKYIVIWKKEEGKWKLHRDIWNSSMPIPGSAAPR